MKEVMLIFPDTSMMVNFIINNEVSGIETKSHECVIVGDLTDNEIMIAEREYEACKYISPFTPKNA